ncbi:MAG: hypothetical protein WDM76_13195 [Limisphaerales bacterium]
MHEILDTLAKEHPVQVEVVKLRYFVGMTNGGNRRSPGYFCGHGEELLDFCPHLDFQRDQ